jgi:hypothetical protein
MATAVSICSNALLMLGANPINSFDDPVDRARLASNLYPDARDAFLRAHPWNAAVKRVALAPTTTAPVFDYAYAFNLPSDWLRTLQVGEYRREPDFKHEGRQILCDENPLYLRYVYRNDAESSWDSMMVQGMTLAMAWAMAYAITKSTTVAQLKEAEFRAFMKQARAVDGQDDPPQELGDFQLLASRSISRVG